MKIAEALANIKDLKGKFSELQRHISSNAVFDLVDPDMEIPNIEDTLNEIVEVSSAISKLKCRIARTNAASGSINKIHTMEHLRSCISSLEHLTHNQQVSARFHNINYSESSVKLVSHATYNVEQCTEKLNLFRKQLRELDLELQRLNWEVDLVE